MILELDALAGEVLPKEASLSLRRGEVLGIAGLVGAGRTELLRALFALDSVRSGEVRINGAVSAACDPRERLDQGVGLLSEDRKGEGLALDLDLATGDVSLIEVAMQMRMDMNVSDAPESAAASVASLDVAEKANR